MGIGCSGCLRYTATVLSGIAQNDTSVIYLPRTKAAPHVPFGLRELGGGSVWGRAL